MIDDCLFALKKLQYLRKAQNTEHLVEFADFREAYKHIGVDRVFVLFELI